MTNVLVNYRRINGEIYVKLDNLIDVSKTQRNKTMNIFLNRIKHQIDTRNGTDKSTIQK